MMRMYDVSNMGNADDMGNTGETFAARFGIHEGDGLQTRAWQHNYSGGFRCVLCGESWEMFLASITLFDGQEQLGDLCDECIKAGPQAAAARTRRRAEELRERAEELDDLAKDLRALDPARWSWLAELEAEQETAHKAWRGMS